jgi:hypothetical protein
MKDKPKPRGAVTINVLIYGAGNELVFKPVTVTPDDLTELIKHYRDPVVKYNIEKELKRVKGGGLILRKLKKSV